MPQPKKRSPEDLAKVDALLGAAQGRTLTPEEVKQLIWILSPFYDPPAFYIDGLEFFFDANIGMLYEQVGDERHYILISGDSLSSFGGGGGANRGKGQFARLSVDKKKLKVPLPEFPKVPANVKAKFPELKKEWERWEEAVEQWVQYVQNQLS